MPGGPKSVLVHLADWYNTYESAAWPTHDQLSIKSGWSRRTTQRHIEWLIEHGYVVKEKQTRAGRQIQNRYRLSVGVMAFQGGQSDAPSCANLTHPGGQFDAPSNTPKDTIKNTPNSGEPQEVEMKASEVVAGTVPDKDEVWAAMKLKNGNLTADSCAKIWRKARAANKVEGFQAELLVKDKGMLAKAAKRIGPDTFVQTVWAVMENWGLFTRHAEKQAGAFNCPKQPQIGWFVRYIEVAADYATQTPEDEDDWSVVQLVSQDEGLTKEKEKTQTTPDRDVMSPEELAEINKELGL